MNVKVPKLDNIINGYKADNGQLIGKVCKLQPNSRVFSVTLQAEITYRGDTFVEVTHSLWNNGNGFFGIVYDDHGYKHGEIGFSLCDIDFNEVWENLTVFTHEHEEKRLNIFYPEVNI